MSPAPAPLPEVTLSEQDGVRYLHLDSPWVQGAMRTARPHFIELVYVQRMLAALLWLPTAEIGQGLAVQLGLGAGALTRFTHHRLGMHTVAVELNPRVVQACRQWFRLPQDGPALQIVIAEAGRWVQERAEPGSAQLLHIDLYDREAAAPVVDDEAFYGGCRALLQPGGVMAVNLFGRHLHFERSVARIAKVFGPDQVWTLRPTREGNTVVVAGRGVQVPGREELEDRARRLQERFGADGLPARLWLRMVKPWKAAAAPPG